MEGAVIVDDGANDVTTNRVDGSDDRRSSSPVNISSTGTQNGMTSPNKETLKGSSEVHEAIANRKRKLTLELPQLIVQEPPRPKGTHSGSPSKSARLSPSILAATQGTGPLLFSSPDERKLQISSPDLERFIFQNFTLGNKTPTPTSAKDWTDEQQLYAKGYMDALQHASRSAGLTQLNMGFSGVPIALPVDLSQSHTPVSLPLSQPLQLIHIPQSQCGMQTPQGQTAHFPQFFVSSANGRPAISPILLNPMLLSQLPLHTQNQTWKAAPPVLASAPQTKPQVVISSPPAPKRRGPKKLPPVSNESADRISYSPSTSLSPSTSEGQRVPSRASSGNATHDGDNVDGPLSYLDNSDEEDEGRKARKRERNRLAAARCRQRKLSKIEELEERVRELKDQNEDLVANADKIRSDVRELKRELARHLLVGCQLNLPENLRKSVEKLMPKSTHVQTEK